MGNDKVRRWYQKLEAVEFSNCAWGGDRPKNTRWLSTPTVILQWLNLVRETTCINRTLSQGRNHFSTSEEAEYPWELAKKVVELVAKFLRYPSSLSQNTPKATQMASGR